MERSWRAWAWVARAPVRWSPGGGLVQPRRRPSSPPRNGPSRRWSRPRRSGWRIAAGSTQSMDPLAMDRMLLDGATDAVVAGATDPPAADERSALGELASWWRGRGPPGGSAGGAAAAWPIDWPSSAIRRSLRQPCWRRRGIGAQRPAAGPAARVGRAIRRCPTVTRHRRREPGGGGGPAGRARRGSAMTGPPGARRPATASEDAWLNLAVVPDAAPGRAR